MTASSRLTDCSPATSTPATSTPATVRPAVPPPPAKSPRQHDPFVHVPASEAERERLIRDIRAINRTASEPFLERFSPRDLRDYLDHLRHARHKQVRLKGWLQQRCEKLEAARKALDASRRLSGRADADLRRAS